MRTVRSARGTFSFLSSRRLVALGLLWLGGLMMPLAAQQAGDFNYSSDGAAITITGHTGEGGAVAIPSAIAGLPVRVIGNNAFWYNSTVTHITLPDGVAVIENAAFQLCMNLTGITLPESLTDIGNEAFAHCHGLTVLTLPKSVTSLGSNAFLGCAGLTSVIIPDSVTSIGANAFSRCTSLMSVVIGDGVTSIDRWTFAGCTALANVTIPDSITSIGESAFADCTALTNLTIPDNVISIGEQAFRGCAALTSVTFGESITTIDRWAFSGATSLTSAKFQGDAPAYFNPTAFAGVPPSFTIYYYEGRVGFTSPTWQDYPAVALAAPPNSDEELRVDSFTIQAGSVSLVVTGQEGWTYELQRLPEPGPGPWPVVLILGPLAETGPLELTDPAAPAAQAFYRVIGRAP